MNWFSVLMILALLVAPTLQAAEDADTQFLKIFSMIDQADLLNSSGKGTQAAAKYREAHRALLELKRHHPIWKPKVVAYRLKYVEEKITALSKPPPAAADTESAGTTSEAGGASSAATANTQIKLLDAGVEPRTLLRLQAKPGDKQTLGMTMKISMDMEMDGMPAQAIKMPAITMDMELTVKDVSADGDITYETSMGDATVADEPGVMPQVTEAIKTSLASVKGLTGTGTISSRGLGKSTDMKLPPGADPQMRQAMEQMQESFSTIMTGLPEEAVGPGARWEVKMPIKSQGMNITQTTTYQLASVEGDVLDIKNTLEQHAANQKIQNPAMPGLKVDVTKMTGSGTGDTKINLTQVLPAQATMGSKSEVVMAVNMAGQKQTMTMKMDMKLRLETK
jgi:hypothetical protein